MNKKMETTNKNKNDVQEEMITMSQKSLDYLIDSAEGTKFREAYKENTERCNKYLACVAVLLCANFASYLVGLTHGENSYDNKQLEKAGVLKRVNTLNENFGKLEEMVLEINENLAQDVLLGNLNLNDKNLSYDVSGLCDLRENVMGEYNELKYKTRIDFKIDGIHGIGSNTSIDSNLKLLGVLCGDFDITTYVHSLKGIEYR